MYLTRSFYLDKIRKYAGKHFIKIIVGQRRVGKTVIMQQLIKKLPANKVLYINKEDKEFDFIMDDTDLYVYIKKQITAGKKILFVDEIQLIKNREKAINSIFSRYPRIDIYITGSNSQILSSELSTLLSGRYIEFMILPFGYDEFISYFYQKKGIKSFVEYMDIGGLPGIYQLSEKELVCEWIKNLINTVFLKDIVSRYKIKDVQLLQEIFMFMVNNIGNITNLAKIVAYLKTKKIKTNLNTLNLYVHALKNAFLVYEVNLYDLQGKAVFDRERKFYISDHIIRSCLFSGYDGGLGKVLENIVFLEVVRNGYSVYVGRIKNNEIDFVIEKNGVKKYLQVTYLLSDKKVIEIEFGNLKLIHDNYEKYVISLDEIHFGNIEGIKHVQIREMNKIF